MWWSDRCFQPISLSRADLGQDSISWHWAYPLALPSLDLKVASKTKKTDKNTQVIQDLRISLFVLTSPDFRNMFLFNTCIINTCIRGIAEFFSGVVYVFFCQLLFGCVDYEYPRLT